MTIKQQLIKQLTKYIESTWEHTEHAFAAGGLAVDFTPPSHLKFGHYTTNIAMRLAPIVKAPPHEIALQLVAACTSHPAVEKAEVAGPGFINVFLKPAWLQRQMAKVITSGKKFGSSTTGKGKRVNIEFISANPTGPLTLGNGRGAFMGDTLAHVLNAAGYKAWREYYVNDMGNQVNILAESVLRRYWISQGIRMEYPDYCYQGEYIEEIAKTLYLPNYALGKSALVEVRDKIKGRILKKMLGNIQRFVTGRLNIKFNTWFSEKTLYQGKKIDNILDALRALGLIYEHDGAIWMKTMQFGDEKDRVLIRKNSEPTYFLPDIAYHHDKLTRRKFDMVINFLGADHAGYAPRMQAAMKALGHGGKLRIIIFQLVRLLSGGVEVRMSKRKGMFVTFEELIDDVGLDAARYFFLMHASSSHMDFDLDLAKKKTKENPVYYVQYAHARICSILRNTQRKPVSRAKPSSDPHSSSIALMVKILQLPELIEDVSGSFALHALPTYAYELATIFHDYYTNVRVIEDDQVNRQPLQLIQATKVALENVLRIMGISAPEKM